MSYCMTEAELNRAMSLLNSDKQAEVKEVKLGRWVIANENGVFGIYQTKAEGIDDALARHCQDKKCSKVQRHREGVYDLRILDADEDPAERFYHTYTLERINVANLLRYRELAMCALLPDWFFDPYSEEYKRYSHGEVV